MGDTIEVTLESIFMQINDSYEVIVVDDGSTDNSREILEALKKKYVNLRVFFLQRSPKRKLGLTRNYSIKQAKGEWCIFHLDADDAIGPYIDEFMTVCATLQDYLPEPVLFSGKQIHVGKREFLLSHGPFRNIYRGEDRNLYGRLSYKGLWVIIDHERFIYRLDDYRNLKKMWKKRIHDIYDQTETDLRYESNLYIYIYSLFKLTKRIGLKGVIFRIVCIPAAWIGARQIGLLQKDRELELDEFQKYRNLYTRTAFDWFDFLHIPRERIPILNKEVFKSKYEII
jgi:glycosyltransferase involved in cell wall biosynthesis